MFLKSWIFGYSARGLPIMAYDFEGSSTDRPVLILGGVHGNEPEGVVAAQFLLKKASEEMGQLKTSVCVVPILNVDGVLSQSRLNGRGVDLNRNLPSNDWSPEAFNKKYPPGEYANSEPENQALTRYLLEKNPQLIVSWHSFENFMLNINGDCRDLAERISAKNSYPVEETIGYPTPGCLGTYAGLERQMPTITYELKRGMQVSEIIGQHAEIVWSELINEFN